MAKNHIERSLLRHGHGFKCFSERADLIHLDQDCVGAVLSDSARKELGIGHEQIIAHKLRCFSQARGQGFPTAPVILAKTVFNGSNGPTLAPLAPHVNHLVAGCHAVWIALEKLVAVLVYFLGLVHQFTGGRVKANHDVPTKFVAGFFNGGGDQIASVLVALQVWREAALVAHGG